MMIDLLPHLFSSVGVLKVATKHYARVLQKHLYLESDVATFSVVAKRANGAQVYNRHHGRMHEHSKR